ncbi:unnamed protein product, partial [Hapterophycus canaliculatus]
MLYISFLIMAGILSRCRSFRLLHHSSVAASSVSSRLKMSTGLDSSSPGTSNLLADLASRVVQGSAERVLVPAGSQLKRRRAWELYVDAADGLKAAVLVVSKKSTFTLDDARTALRIMREEAAARCPDGETKESQQLLLTTRAGVAPAADAFLQGRANLAHSNMIGEGGVAILRWEKLERLVQNGSIGSYLTTTNTRHKEGSGVLKAPSFTLPAWLLEERERGASAAFDLHAPFEPAGDQPEAIKNLSRGLKEGKRYQTLLGATGTGKTFIVANVIQEASLPTLVLAPNKASLAFPLACTIVLASQLTNELRALFPNNAVEFFVSFYDYYLPEAFNPASDTYIDKVVQINDDIDRMRHSATRSLLERKDVIVVSSVSCIYGLGMPGKYLEASIRIVVGQEWTGGWTTLLAYIEKGLFYTPKHSQEEFEALPRGSFRSIPDGRGGGVVEIGPASDETIVRVTMDAAGVLQRIQVVPIAAVTEGGEESLAGGRGGEDFQHLSDLLPPQSGSIAGTDVDVRFDCGRKKPTLPSGGGQTEGHRVEAHVIYPAKHHVVGRGELDQITSKIAEEMEERCLELGREGKVLEAERLRQRTENDLMLLGAVGTCKGVENYSRHLAGRGPGDPPETLVDYFPEKDWLLVVDESHVSAPQLGAMWGGDQARKRKLVEHGFRLPSALDNRPLK